MTRVAFCVTTIERPAALEAMLLSIAAHRPDASVHVADQSEEVEPTAYEALGSRLREAGLRRPLTLHRLPFDCGLSAARNHLVESTPEEYKLILDDDFLFTERTDVDALTQLLDGMPEAGVVGGGVVRGGRLRHVGTVLRRDGRTVRQVPATNPPEEHDGVRFVRVHCVPNFALIRGELFEQMRWDPALKIAGEHIDFFLRLQQTQFAVLYAPDVTVDHQPKQPHPGYRRLRLRGEFIKQVLLKHDIDRLERAGGGIAEFRPDGSLTTYRATR